MTTSRRLVAEIGRLAGAPKTRHTIRDQKGPERPLPAPDVVLLEIEPNGTAQIYRYTANGEFGGDTWHQTEDDAIHQLRSEYGSAVGSWESVPEAVPDGVDFAVSWILARRSS